MKAAIFYCLFVCAWLMGIYHPAEARMHGLKLHHSSRHLVDNKLLDRDIPIDIEDESDDKDISKKVVVPAKWLPSLAYLFEAHIAHSAATRQQQSSRHPHSSDINILQRVLRI